MQERAACLRFRVVHPAPEFDNLKQVLEHLSVVEVYSVEKAFALLFGPTEPVIDELVPVDLGLFKSMFEENLEALKLVGEATEDKGAEVAVVAHAA